MGELFESGYGSPGITATGVMLLSSLLSLLKAGRIADSGMVLDPKVPTGRRLSATLGMLPAATTMPLLLATPPSPGSVEKEAA